MPRVILKVGMTGLIQQSSAVHLSGAQRGGVVYRALAGTISELNYHNMT